MDDWQTCDHEWEDFDDEYPNYRLSICMICGAYRHQDFVNGKDEISEPDPGPTVEHDERGAYIWSYGHFGGGDPRDFEPDYELCTPQEIERWKSDVARVEAGEDLKAPSAGEWNKSGTIHILAPVYGIGTYKYRLDDDEDAQP